ncbi:hypothetical protein ACWCPT_19140 [Streptomyces sp. NPDC002308]
MHIPAYAHDTIRAAVLPRAHTSHHVGGLHCCLCDEPFGADLAAIPLGPTEKSGLFGCRPCLTQLIARARRTRDAALVHDAAWNRVDSAAWEAARDHHLARLGSVREAAEAVAELAESGKIAPLGVAWLLISLESANTWVPDTPEPKSSVDREETVLTDEAFRLSLAMITAREAVANQLAYHLINEAHPEEPEMCEELECPEGCSGRHDSSYIDCGPDAIFEDLAEHGINVQQPEPEPLSPRMATLMEKTQPDTKPSPLPDFEEHALAALAHYGIGTNETDVLVSAAAVGLVADAWRDGPLDVIHAAVDGPTDGEIFAQSVDLYRRARTALVAAENDGPEALLAFVAVASDVDLPWAGGSRFALRSISDSTAEFVMHVDNRVWLTAEVMRQQGWHAAVLQRAVSAVFKAPTHFGMPGWPSAVASAMEGLALLDRSEAPEALADLRAVKTSLLRAPDELGADALSWISRHGLLSEETP